MARLLISAFSCFPGEGSEPGVGWKSVAEAAKAHEVWVITDCARREALLAHPEVKALPNVHWKFQRVPLLSAWAHGPWSNTGVWWLYYLAWQVAQAGTAKRLHREVGFDLCHHATYVKYNTPSWLPSLGIPFLWGPVGGGERVPLTFFRNHGWKTLITEAIRVGLQKLAVIDVCLRWTASQCTRALAVTRETESEMWTLGARQTGLLPAVSLDDVELETIRRSADDPTTRADVGDLTLLFVGRLIPWKGVDLAIRALAASDREDLRFRVIGEGPERSRLEGLAASLGIAGRVEFAGVLPRDEVLAAYGHADGFLYPSLHDSGGQVVLEAMAAGLPVICLRVGGPNTLVDEGSGWKVTAREPRQVVTDLAESLREFASGRELRMARGISARTRAARTFSAGEFGRHLRKHYADLLGGAG